MKKLDMLVSSAITATFPRLNAAPELCVEANTISAEEAEAILKEQRRLVANLERAHMHRIRQEAPDSAYFTEVELNSRAIGLLVADRDLRLPGSAIPPESNYVEANLARYAGSALLDPRDMLFEEPTWSNAYATCFLVGSNRVLTAWHVFCCDNIARRDLHEGKLRVVFDFDIGETGRARSVFSKGKNVFEVKSIESLPCPEQQGWVVLELGSCATGDGWRTPLTCSTSELTANTPVYTLGHPKHLSKRYVTTALELAIDGYQFGAYVDAYEGSSGSPVFSALDHKVVGMVNWSSQTDGYVKICGEFRRVSQLCLPRYASEATLCFNSAAFANEFTNSMCT